jgi:hypothetical protein
MAVKKTTSAPSKDDAKPKSLEEGYSGELVTFIPAASFTGYVEPYDVNPAGIVFTKGVESIPVPKDFVDLMREKNLVADK